MNIRTENWLGYDIRFVEQSPDEWWAVSKDISDALGYKGSRQMTRYLESEELSTFNWKKNQSADIASCFSDFKYKPNVPIISELGIYEAGFNSQRPEAKEFKRWVKELLRNIRKSTGLEGFQVFRMLDKNKTHPIRTQ
ncbi:Bro-N domain-containing protein [Paenibacillus taichungensis]|uniref:BRO-N domain-containing protein n=1 Tax=Paenibacillus taichungensis TaxID=484184 RepID=UPI0038D1C500